MTSSRIVQRLFIRRAAPPASSCVGSARVQPRVAWLGGVLAALVVGGLVLVALPDAAGSEPVLVLSGSHGPSGRDLVGLAPALLVVTAGWVLVVVRAGRVRRVLGGGPLAVTLAGWAVAVLLCVTAVLSDAGWWWVPPMLVALAAQARWAYAAACGR